MFHKYTSQDKYNDFFHKEKCYKNDKDEKDANEEKNNNEKKCDKWKYIVNYANYIKGIKRLSNETNKKYLMIF